MQSMKGFKEVSGSLLVLLLVAFLSACGGGGSSGAPPVSTEVSHQETTPSEVETTSPPDENQEVVTPAIKTKPDPVARMKAYDVLAAGKQKVLVENYSLGMINVQDAWDPDRRYTSNITGNVHFPMGGEDYPLIVLLHGQHRTDRPNHEGYNYLGSNLASHGYVVISIDANDINNGNGLPSIGAAERAELVLTTLRRFRYINQYGGYGLDSLINKMDFSRIGLMGHSRGGEGIDRAVAENQKLESPFSIKAAFTLAPMDLGMQVPTGVAFASMHGYCDGDVYYMTGNSVYDTVRFNNPDNYSYQIVPMGSNHNFFNTVWADDNDDWDLSTEWCDMASDTTGRDSKITQKNIGLFFMSSFFRYFVGGEKEVAPLWTGYAEIPESLCEDRDCSERFRISMTPPKSKYLLIDDFISTRSMSLNNLNGYTFLNGFSFARLCMQSYVGGTQACSTDAPVYTLSGMLNMRWNRVAMYRTEVGDLNVTDYQALSFRVGFDHQDEGHPDLSVILEDINGNRAPVRLSDFNSLYYPPGDQSERKILLNQASIPLLSFKGVDYRHISAIEIVTDQTEQGNMVLNDLMLYRVD